jgi:catechol 2,3-dioxygenase-like lactoylglutathione lyase family enzyme
MSATNDHPAIAPTALDHVALWAADRDALAAFLCDHLGMHEIDRTDRFTLVGSDARRGKITLFDADGPREQGALARVVLRVNDLAAAVDLVPGDAVTSRDGDVVAIEGPQGLGLGLTQAAEGADTIDYDIDHIVLRVPDAERASRLFAKLGLEPSGDRLVVGDKHVRVEGGGSGEPERPLLNHIALLVDSAVAIHDEARRRGIEVADYVDAENTVAVFLMGPDGIKLEYVEHKPSFSLV